METTNTAPVIQGTTKPNYLSEYDTFQASYRRTEISPEEVGEIIMHQASYFSSYNIDLVIAEGKFAKKAQEIEKQTDDNGKPISSTKAKVFSDATSEAVEFNLCKAHVQNIEQIINALKALQKGVLNEYAHSGM